MTRRILTVLAVASTAVFASCNKEAHPANGELVTLTFNYGLSGGTPFITKSTESNFLFSLTPTASIEITLDDGHGHIYYAKTGKTVTLPAGHYTATYTTEKPSVVQHYNADAYFTQEPLLMINEEVDITAQTTSIGLTAKYLSSAILFDLSEVQNIRVQAQTGSNFDLPFATGGGLGAVFFTGHIEGKTCVITVIPKDGYQGTAVQINTDGFGGAHILEAGKYYFLRLMQPDATTSFSFTAMDWTEGDSLT